MSKVTTGPPECDLWRIVWHALAAHGLCDEWAGAECRRVTAEWIAARRPIGRAEFIIAHAEARPMTGARLAAYRPDLPDPA